MEWSRVEWSGVEWSGVEVEQRSSLWCGNAGAWCATTHQHRKERQAFLFLNSAFLLFGGRVVRSNLCSSVSLSLHHRGRVVRDGPTKEMPCR